MENAIESGKWGGTLGLPHSRGPVDKELKANDNMANPSPSTYVSLHVRGRGWPRSFSLNTVTSLMTRATPMLISLWLPRLFAAFVFPRWPRKVTILECSSYPTSIKEIIFSHLKYTPSYKRARKRAEVSNGRKLQCLGDNTRPKPGATRTGMVIPVRWP